MNFKTGKQPCDNFKPATEVNEYASWDNLHECYRCKEGKVSFCDNCNRDHHTNGYDTCKED